MSTFHIADPAVHHRDCAKRFHQHFAMVVTEKAEKEPEGEQEERNEVHSESCL